MRRSTLVFVGLIALAGVLLASRATHRAAPPPASSAPPTVAGPSDQVAHPEIGFRSDEQLTEHFRKHGREFDAGDAGAYLALAQALRDRAAGGEVVEAVRHDRVVTRYDRASGAFIAFNPDLTIRTFFRPNDGEAYFRRQLERGH
jgi:pyocin large subunit-like protein